MPARGRGRPGARRAPPDRDRLGAREGPARRASSRELSSAWEELGGPTLARGELDIEGDAGVLTPVGEPTLRSRSRARSTAPLGDVAADPLGRGRADRRASMRDVGSAAPPRLPMSAPALRRGLAGAQVLLRAEVGSVQMPIERMLELAPGRARASSASAPRTACALYRRGGLARPRAPRAQRHAPGGQARGHRRARPCAPTPTRSSAAPSSSARARTPTRGARRAPRAARSCAASSCACGPSSAARTSPLGGARAGPGRGRRARPGRRGAGRAVRQRPVLRQRQPRRHRRGRAGACRWTRSSSHGAARPASRPGTQGR